MSVQPDDLQAFHQFVETQLTRGGQTLSPEECLDAWREQHPDERLYESSVAELRAAIVDMHGGDQGQRAHDILADARRRHGLPTSS